MAGLVQLPAGNGLLMASTTTDAVTAPSHERADVRWGVLAAFVAVPVVAGGVIGVLSSPGPWYDGLDKAPLNPPSWVFGPVWTLLYVTIGVAGYLAWRADGERWIGPVVGLWTAQLVLNLAWTPIFFGAEAPELALIEIAVLFVAVVATIVVFSRRSAVAAALMVPYALWVGFAGYLTAYIVLAN